MSPALYLKHKHEIDIDLLVSLLQTSVFPKRYISNVAGGLIKVQAIKTPIVSLLMGV